MTEFGLLKARGIIGFSDVTKTIQNAELMSRVMNYASDLDVLIMQHAEEKDADLRWSNRLLCLNHFEKWFLHAILGNHLR